MSHHYVVAIKFFFVIHVERLPLLMAVIISFASAVWNKVLSYY